MIDKAKAAISAQKFAYTMWALGIGFGLATFGIIIGLIISDQWNDFKCMSYEHKTNYQTEYRRWDGCYVEYKDEWYTMETFSKIQIQKAVEKRIVD